MIVFKNGEGVMEKIYMTPEGFKVLEDELKNLKQVERPAVIQAIADARALGDLSENAEYHYAKDKQGLIEGRIKELEGKLALAEVIDITKMTGTKVRFGTTVIVFDIDTDEEFKYKIVGVDEADISKGLLSISSPLGKTLLGKDKGDEVKFITPGGKKTYEIVEVMYK